MFFSVCEKATDSPHLPTNLFIHLKTNICMSYVIWFCPRQRITAIPRESKSKINGFLNMIGVGTADSSPKNRMDIQVTEFKGPAATDICTINLGTAVPELNSNKFLGPVIRMSLPSFSGCTEYNPHLLKYSCQIECRIRAVQPAEVSGPSLPPKIDTEKSSECQSFDITDTTTREVRENERNLSISVMLSKPILALEFNCLKMQVEAPIVVSPCSKYILKRS
uniref:Uncharacterized protein n=1 Tax=Davidia involucrata TaxID=16924 RepID=A0A5B7A846_DAVIN